MKFGKAKILCFGFKITILWFVLLSATAVQAGEIVLVLSHDKGPYQDVMEPIEAAFGNALSVIVLSNNYSVASAQVLGLKASETEAVIALGKKAIGLVKQIPKEISVYYSLVYNPVEFENRNATGILVGIEIEQQIKMLHELFPERNQIGVIFNPNITGVQVNEARKIVRLYNMELLAVPVGSRSEIESACHRFSSDAVDLFLLLADRTVVHPESLKKIAGHTKANQIPLVGLSKFHVTHGAMVAFAVNFNDVGRQITDLVRSGKVNINGSGIIRKKKIDVFMNESLKNEMNVTDIIPSADVILIQ